MFLVHLSLGHLVVLISLAIMTFSCSLTKLRIRSKKNAGSTDAIGQVLQYGADLLQFAHLSFDFPFVDSQDRYLYQHNPFGLTEEKKLASDKSNFIGHENDMNYTIPGGSTVRTSLDHWADIHGEYEKSQFFMRNLPLNYYQPRLSYDPTTKKWTSFPDVKYD